MQTFDKPTVTVAVTLKASLGRAWTVWTDPEHIIHWNFAADSWQCPSAENDVRPGGTFSWRMEAKDGSMGFDYTGHYLEVEPEKRILKELGDGRRVEITFAEQNGTVVVTETFEVEDQHTAEMQRQGWQSILNQYQARAESIS